MKCLNSNIHIFISKLYLNLTIYYVKFLETEEETIKSCAKTNVVKKACLEQSIRNQNEVFYKLYINL